MLRLNVAGIYCRDILTRFIGQKQGFVERLCGTSNIEDLSPATPTPAPALGPQEMRGVVVGVD